MIPLAQYLSDIQGEEFVPLRAVSERRAPARPAGDPPFVRTLKPVAARKPVPLAQAMAPAPEVKKVPLAELEAERAAWAAEREALQAAVEEARQEARDETQAAVRAEMEAAGEAAGAAVRAEMESAHEEALAAARERWSSEQADRLADLMILQLAVFEDTMKATVKNVLRPLAMDARQRRALEDLADAVKVIAPEGAEFRFAATGPSDLLEKLREKLGDKAGRLSVKPDESRVDIRLDADATTIETRLSAWGKALEKALS
ncbi:hypothetical protein [Aureimonas populi]|uniref:Flagellar assembly protein FliH/Type III secretion system HrpE domain-containing protein n=1 Tax=Aureimonas populi TaxID=1701758 RepID=A0ABW5CK65_9HYPH|nr:hypothetical protein [Aureimonas populi]